MTASVLVHAAMLVPLTLVAGALSVQAPSDDAHVEVSWRAADPGPLLPDAAPPERKVPPLASEEPPPELELPTVEPPAPTEVTDAAALELTAPGPPVRAPEPWPTCPAKAEPSPAQTVTAAPAPASPSPTPAPRPVRQRAPAAQPAAPAGPLQRARVLQRQRPVYPQRCQRRGHAGVTHVLVEIGTDGRARNLKVVQSAGCARLDAAALEAVRGYRFRPATRGGSAVATRERIAVRFDA